MLSLSNIDSDEDEPVNTIVLKMERKPKSVFIKLGEYLKEYSNDPKYDIQNFEFLKLGKDFHIIGEGAFCEVYLVKNKTDGKYYALKKMEIKKVLENGGSLEVIQREISIHRRLNHENIVKLRSHYQDDTHFYLIMDYISKGTLYQLIKLNNGCDEKTAFHYFIQVVAAVDFLHENHLIHRDLKPENMLIDGNKRLFLCDFGWCVEIKKGNRVTFCGTFEYMAPELIKELPYNQAVDVWSLGVLLYELLHGYSPFKSDENSESGYTEIFTNILTNSLTFDKKVSEKCRDLITKLLTLDKDQRLKVSDIFSHPWVAHFEPESIRSASAKQDLTDKTIQIKKENIIPQENSSTSYLTDLMKGNANRKSKIGVKMTQKNPIKIEIDNNEVTNDIMRKYGKNKNLQVSKSSKEFLSSAINISPEERENEECKDIKLLKDSKYDYDTNNNSFFDKVISQVEKKKKIKHGKKKSPSPSPSQSPSHSPSKLVTKSFSPYSIQPPKSVISSIRPPSLESENPAEDNSPLDFSDLKAVDDALANLYETQVNKINHMSQRPSKTERGSVLFKRQQPTTKPVVIESEIVTTLSTDFQANKNSNQQEISPYDTFFKKRIQGTAALEILDKAKESSVLKHSKIKGKEAFFWGKIGTILNPFATCKGK